MFLDSVTLSAAEWSALAPLDARAGSEWTIPEEIGRRFFPLLNPFDIKFRDPAEVTEVQLVGRVATIRKGVACLVYAGRIAGTHRGTKSEASEGKALSSALTMAGGVGAYDIQAGKMLSLTWVWDGRFRSYPPYADPPIRFGAVAEWRQRQPAAAAQLEAKAPGPETNGELADSTPEDAFKTFLVALAAQDEATLRAVTLPDAEFEWLLKAPKAPPDVLARIKAWPRRDADETADPPENRVRNAGRGIPGHQTDRRPRGTGRALAGRCATSVASRQRRRPLESLCASLHCSPKAVWREPEPGSGRVAARAALPWALSSTVRAIGSAPDEGDNVGDTTARSSRDRPRGDDGAGRRTGASPDHRFPGPRSA